MPPQIYQNGFLGSSTLPGRQSDRKRSAVLLLQAACQTGRQQFKFGKKPGRMMAELGHEALFCVLLTAEHRLMQRRYSTLMLLAALATARVVSAQQEEENPFLPGLVASYASENSVAKRTDEVIAFDWQTASPDPRLPSGSFTANWRGRLMTTPPGKYKLHCFVQGRVQLTLASKIVVSGRAEQPQWMVSEELELPFDRHPLEIEFEKTNAAAQLLLCWSGPGFSLEPISERFLLHDRADALPNSFERGRQLAAALRCGACHKDETAVTPAPALDRLSGNIQEGWLIEWLSAHQATGDREAAGTHALRRMPEFGLNRDEATAIAAWLLREPALEIEVKQNEQKITKGTKEGEKKSAKKGKGDGKEEKPKPSAEQGERIVLSRGCLACHQWGTLGESGLFGGGDLTGLFNKRSPDFLLRWLENPGAINRAHRMPLFTFTSDEAQSLKLWAEERSRAASPALTPISKGDRSALIRDGMKLVETFHCANCHLVARDKNELAAAFRPALASASNWSQSCAGQPDRQKGQPGYQLAPEDQQALQIYYSQSRPGEGRLSPQARGRDLLTQLNCLACHQREGLDRAATLLPARLQDKLTAVAESHPDLAPLIPSMTPPALNSIGDKLHDAALAEAINRKGTPHRPYMLAQMPRFAVTEEQLASLTAYFTATDRMPESSPLAPRGTSGAEKPASPTESALAAAGPRLVTADGLACTSCHQVGSVLPAKAPLNARGPDLSMLAKRIRREWFDRWCANPARIVPRMEMPSVQVAVRGVLNENVHDQLAAVWNILNTPGFEPPEPNPVRVVRLSGVPERNERPVVIHDVFKDGDKTYLFPLVIGLPNRHNILFDLETNRLAAWWLGDAARQRTKGKSWYWETGGKSIVDFGPKLSELSLMIGETEVLPAYFEQFAANLNEYFVDGTVLFSMGRLTFVAAQIPESRGIGVEQVGWSQFFTISNELQGRSGFERQVQASGTGIVDHVRLRLVGPEIAASCKWDESSGTLSLPGAANVAIQVTRPKGVKWNSNGTITVPTRPYVSIRDWSVAIRLIYSTSLPVDQYLADPIAAKPVASQSLEIAPGFAAQRLPLRDDIMPSGLAWKKGDLHFCTLKGEVYLAKDANADGEEDSLHLVKDGLATPYGIQFSPGGSRLDVAAKDGLLALEVFRQDYQARSIRRLLRGWGHTDDYHDWAVGPVAAANGDYFIALPCQQDQRSDAAAQYRGNILRLKRKTEPLNNDQPYEIEIVSSGHRFPMGMARNRAGDMFVTDNQGNYNPFNELNHVRKGAHFGFINALEKEKGYVPPPLTPPAINIPHPWTRSVNGICFLETPDALRRVGSAHQPSKEAEKVGTAHPTIFGPLEGHLVGCEYDTRRLIRMSLQKIGDTFQGCAYPLSIPPEEVEKGLLGPIVCAIKPTTGELYVGEIRDSGWGASNNIGQIVKIKIEPEKLPCGIAEVRATATGFTIDFFQPADRAKAADVVSYSIASYRRESTPAYGGADIDRRDEKISRCEVSSDGKRATLTLPELRPGHVYELHVKNLTPGGGMFHPDEAHYTLNQIPRN